MTTQTVHLVWEDPQAAYEDKTQPYLFKKGIAKKFEKSVQNTESLYDLYLSLQTSFAIVNIERLWKNLKDLRVLRALVLRNQVGWDVCRATSALSFVLTKILRHGCTIQHSVIFQKT
jgi:hypothetical protein